MDNVLVDFQSGIDQLDLPTKIKYIGRYDEVPGIFSKMLPLKDAVESFYELSKHFDTYILSTSPWENHTAPSDKLKWVKIYLGNKARKRQRGVGCRNGCSLPLWFLRYRKCYNRQQRCLYPKLVGQT